ncbi:MAG: hypothetical protein R3A48_28515 [Polyangiales bacterium]
MVRGSVVGAVALAALITSGRWPWVAGYETRATGLIPSTRRVSGS